MKFIFDPREDLAQLVMNLAGNPCPTYRKPFDLIAETVKMKDWLAFVDDL
jgi:hypothetical protein